MAADNHPHSAATVRRKIALAITELEPGGAERRLVDLALGLHARASTAETCEVRLYILAERPAAGRDALAASLSAAGIRAEFLGCRSLASFPRAVWRLRRRLAEWRPDVLQTFLYHANVVGLLAGKWAGVTRRFAGVRVADPRRGRVWLERQVARLAQGVVCVSEGTREFCQRRGFPSERLMVIPNCVDAEHFARAMPAELAPLGVPAGRRVLLGIGRLDRQKGFDRLLAALPAVFDAAPDVDVLLVGDGPERAALARQTEVLGVAARVHFLGRRAEVAELLAASELLVLPSRWEGMPNVVLEAMAAGKPVVAAPVEGVAELLGPQAAAQTAPAENFAEFAGLLLKLLGDGVLRRTLGAANQARARSEFSREQMIERYWQAWFGRQ